MAGTAQSAKLVQILAEQGIDATQPPDTAFVKNRGQFFLDALATNGITACDDFLGIVSRKTYETEWAEWCVFELDKASKPPHGALTAGNKETWTDKLLCSRVKKAWEILNRQREEQKGPDQTVNSSRLDDELPDATQLSLKAAWKSRYDFELEEHLCPCDALVARMWRELKAKTPTVLDLAKVKAVSQSTAPEKIREIPIDQRTTINIREDTMVTQSIRSVIHYYFQMRILGNAYAYAGTEEVDSVVKVGGPKVVFCPFAQQVDYADMALRLTSELAVGQAAALQWMRARDTATRAGMVMLIRKGYPQGEALELAIKDNKIQWENGPKNVTDAQITAAILGNSSASQYDNPARVRAPTFGQQHGVQKCIAWNAGHCNDPSCARLHVCNHVGPAGGHCGLEHPRYLNHAQSAKNPKKRKFMATETRWRADAKGRGGKGGKGKGRGGKGRGGK